MLLYGVLLILLGVGMFYYVYKFPNETEFDEGISAPNFGFYLLGILFIAIGISLLLKS